MKEIQFSKYQIRGAYHWDHISTHALKSNAFVKGRYRYCINLLEQGLGKNLHNKKIIDIGCGEGFLTRTILDRFPNAIAFASDVAQEMLSKAAKLLDSYGSRIHLSRDNIHE